MASKPAVRQYNRRGGRPGLNVDFKAVCDAVQGAWSGNGDTVTEIAARFGVSRAWIHEWIFTQHSMERKRTAPVDIRPPSLMRPLTVP